MTVDLSIALFVKSAIVALAGLVVSGLAGGRPVDRVDILRASVCLLLALPLISLLAPALTLHLLPASSPPPAPTPLWTGEVRPVAGLAVSGSLWWPSLGAVAAMVWVVGALVIAARFGAGVWTLRRWTREASPVSCPVWTGPLEPFEPGRRPRLLSSARVSGPLSWGLSPGVVLIDRASLRRPQTASAVMAHELAHLGRRDWLFLVLSRLAVALFWFNPLVWRLHTTLIARSEDAADAAAVGSVDRHDYARTLVGLAAGATPAASAGMAAEAHSLKRRIANIMTAPARSPRRPLATFLTIAAMAAVATPLAALEIVARMPPAPPAPPEAPLPPAPPAPPSPPEPPAVWLMQAPPVPPAPPVAPVAPVAPPAPPEPPTGQGVRTYSYFRTATPEDIVAAEAARAAADDARRQADRVRAEADRARGEADRSRAEADVSRVAAERGRAAATAAADQARVAARQAQAEARVHMANARVEMRRGSEQMKSGAVEMRRESIRLRDPAYRARQIEKARQEGNTVTDSELLALSPRLAVQADEMDRQAAQMLAEAAGRS